MKQAMRFMMGIDLPGAGHCLVLSICGGSGCGKSTLAKAVCARLGQENASRIPTDYYLCSNPFASLAEFMARPLAYDWPAVESALAEPQGTPVSTPDYDFVAFRRLAGRGGMDFVIRPLMIIDAMVPYPRADLTVLLDAPDDERRRRILARDHIWGTEVIAHGRNTS
jgi:uridine kinase